MTPETTSSSSSSESSSRPPLKNAEERLMVAVRIRPMKPDETQRVLYASNKKVRVACAMMGMRFLFARVKVV